MDFSYKQSVIVCCLRLVTWKLWHELTNGKHTDTMEKTVHTRTHEYTYTAYTVYYTRYWLIVFRRIYYIVIICTTRLLEK